jgi:hypothetical protein
LNYFRWSTALGLLVAALLVIPAHASDHLDGPAVIAQPEADISDLYTWMDGNNVVLVMGVTPFATLATKFSDKIQYVFHTQSQSMFFGTPTPLDIICTFDVAQKVSCWVGTADYLSGDASATTGLTSASGKVKVFAGLRDDPAFFNVDGFNLAATEFRSVAANVTYDAAGCPALNAAQAAALAQSLSKNPLTQPPSAALDAFSGKNVLGLVVSIDKTLLTAGGPIVSVWASTNKVN